MAHDMRYTHTRTYQSFYAKYGTKLMRWVHVSRLVFIGLESQHTFKRIRKILHSTNKTGICTHICTFEYAILLYLILCFAFMSESKKPLNVMRKNRMAQMCIKFRNFDQIF